jgi:hypothetical protein
VWSEAVEATTSSRKRAFTRKVVRQVSVFSEVNSH